MMRNFLLTAFFNFLVLTTAHAQQEFWGTAAFGGMYGDGFIYKTNATGDNLEIVHHFRFETDGEDISALTLASNNKLYGMAAAGGVNSGGQVFSGGTFFEFDLATNTFRVLEHFGAANTALPGVVLPLGSGNAALTEVSPGILYGVMRQGSYVFAYNISTGVFTQPFVLPAYTGGPTNSTLQNKLNRAFIKAADGNFYVTTASNSSCPVANPNMGSIMRMNAAGTSIAVRHLASCLVANGHIYRGPLAEKLGKFYGVTNYGGATNNGVLFEYNFAANTFLKRHDFISVYSFEPQALAFGTNGKLYGVAHGGGIPEPNLGPNAGGGVLFEFDVTTGDFAVKHNFTLAGQSIYDLGIFPTSLIAGTNGKLYGATQFGVFEYDIEAATIRTAGRFNDIGFAPSVVQVCRKPYYSPVQSVLGFCTGDPVTIDLQSNNAVSVEWEHNGIPDPTQTSTTLTLDAFTEADAGTWRCTLTNACGSTVTQTITLTANTPEQPEVTAGGPVTFCSGESVTLTAPEGYSDYHWSSEETTREITVTETGSFAVTVSNGCTSEQSEAIAVVVNPLPEAPTLTQEYDHGFVLTAGGGSTYQWLLNGEDVGVSGERITDATAGEYTVYAINEYGCRSATSAFMMIVITDAEGELNGSIHVYPNPVDGLLTVRMPEGNGIAFATLSDITGRPVLIASLAADETLLDVGALVPGLYLLRIDMGGKARVKKVQVMR